MIRFNSVTANGDEELANYCHSLLQERGFKANLQQVTHSVDDFSKRQFNVIGILGDPLVDKKIRKGLLLSTHLDTVSPGLPENWVETGGDPFAATIKDGKIYGLGAAEAKLDFLCKLHAAAKFREKKLRMPIYLVGTCGEEAGMFGARYLIKAGDAQSQVRARGGAYGAQDRLRTQEPPDFQGFHQLPADRARRARVQQAHRFALFRQVGACRVSPSGRQRDPGFDGLPEARERQRLRACVSPSSTAGIRSIRCRIAR